MQKSICTILIAILCLQITHAQTPAYPFPQHVSYTAGSIKPTVATQANLDKEVKKFYDKWKLRYMVNGCEPDQYYVFYNYEGFADPSDAICVSEAQGYGMLITALMAGYDVNAKTIFDGLYNYYKAHPSIIDPILMGWQQVEGCINTEDADAATDGDIDIAYGLLLAHAQWGSGGSINYLSEAINLIDAIYASEINHNNQTVKLGDWASGSTSTISYSTRSSDFICDHFRSFKDAADDANWDLVVDRCYTILDAIQTNYSSSTGLIPDFIRKTNTAPKPAAPNFLESDFDGEYNYNACRVPWRIATDYLVYGDVRAYDALTTINNWIKTKTASTPGQIKSGYYIASGNVLPGANYNDLSFQAPFGVSAMISADNQTWLNSLWNYYKTVNISRDGYYGNSIKMLSLIVMSGNWWSPDAAIPKQANNFTEGTMNNAWPNPADEKLYISRQNIDAAVSLLDAHGRIVYQSNETGAENYEISTAALPEGIYFLHVSGSENSSVQKIVIQH